MKIALFHYHLQNGGVTDVIIFTARVLLKNRPEIQEIRLVSGESESSEAVLEKIRLGFDRQTADKIRFDVLPEIAYREGKATPPDSTSLRERLEARYDEETLWWIHNYHLGKNVVLTQALMDIAKSGKRKMVFHIHDFPECGRYENLAKLDEYLESAPYVSGPNIRYAVINERDRRLLADGGLGAAVFLLGNPVPKPPMSPANPQDFQSTLETYARDRFPAFRPNGRNLLYPVRAIRRKNILEAGLLASLLDEKTNLIVTLPGTSSQEARYSKAIERAFSDGLIPGVWCPEESGNPLLAYPTLAAQCDGIVSSSVQEGFGFLFLNALYWGKPLLARYLDILDGILDLFGDYPRRFWADFRVPDINDLGSKTIEAYRNKLESLSGKFSERTLKSMESAIGKLVSVKALDVSFLSVDDQLKVLEKSRDDESWREETRLLNKDLLDSIDRTLRAVPPIMDQSIESRFGDSAFMRSFEALWNSFGNKVPTPPPQKIRDNLEKAFGRIDYLRMIYDY